MYGVYQSADVFFSSLLENPADKRFGYEIILEGQPCKIYFDIEWIGPADTGHHRIYRCLKNLCDDLLSNFNVDPAIHVCCGSRIVSSENGQIWKHSFHVVVDNIAAASNEIPAFRRYVDLAARFNHLPDWFYQDPKKGR